MPVQHKNLSASSLKTFIQHGFNPIKESGEDHVYGSCIFCGKDNKFYINVETKMWQCKSCGMEGGYKSWLKEVHTYCLQYFQGDTALKLAKERCITTATLRHAQIGFNPYTQSYILPVFSVDGDEITDLKIDLEQ